MLHIVPKKSVSSEAPSHGELQQLAGDMCVDMAWPIREVVRNAPFAIQSDGRRQEHVVRWPSPGSFAPPAYLDYLHELMHARMAEQVHPLFASPAFHPSTDATLCEQLFPAFEAAADWFVDWELLQSCPDRKHQDMARTFASTVKQLERPGVLDKALAVSLGLKLAQGIHLLGRNLTLEGPLERIVDAFGRTPADKPSLFTLRALANRLLEPLHQAKAEMASNAGGQVWRIQRLAAAPTAA